MTARILIVDHERPVLELLSEVLGNRGFEVCGVGDGQKAVDAFRARPFDLVLADLIMPGMSGMEVIGRIREMDGDAEVILLTGYATIENAIRALKNYKAFDLLTKPLENLDSLHNKIEKALERRRLQKENQHLIQTLRRVNGEVEEKVSARTLELERVNELLRKELARHEKREEELRKADKFAETASRVKSDFLANMSHEFRNSLNTILGFSEILIEKYFGPLNEKQEQYVKEIHNSGQRLLKLINDPVQNSLHRDETYAGRRGDHSRGEGNQERGKEVRRRFDSG